MSQRQAALAGFLEGLHFSRPGQQQRTSLHILETRDVLQETIHQWETQGDPKPYHEATEIPKKMTEYTWPEMMLG